MKNLIDIYWLEYALYVGFQALPGLFEHYTKENKLRVERNEQIQDEKEG